MFLLLADKASLGSFKWVIGIMMLVIILVIGGLAVAVLWESMKKPGERKR